jgi:hypothetical protein
VRSPQRWKIIWLLLTMCLFLGPFLLVVIQYRYINPHVVPLALLLCLVVALDWRRSGAESAAAGMGWIRWARIGAAVVVLLAFTWSEIIWMKPLTGRSSTNTYRLLGKKIRNQGLTGPFASDSRARAILMSYHSGHKYLGFPLTEDPATASTMLQKAGARYIIVWNTLRGLERESCATELVAEPGWTEVIHFRGATVYAYNPSLAATRPATTRRATSRPTTRPKEQGEPDMLEGFEEEIYEGPAARAAKKPRPTKPFHKRKKVAMGNLLLFEL